MPETVTIDADSDFSANEKGWFEIKLADGRLTATKDEEVAKAAFQARGSEVEAEIGTQVKGNFTNHYLNSVNGVGGRPAAGGRKKTAAAPRSGGGRSPAENDRIARQWAYGRATELLIAAGGPASFPLKPDEMSQLAETAEALLNATKS